MCDIPIDIWTVSGLMLTRVWVWYAQQITPWNAAYSIASVAGSTV